MVNSVLDYFGVHSTGHRKDLLIFFSAGLLSKIMRSPIQ